MKKILCFLIIFIMCVVMCISANATEENRPLTELLIESQNAGGLVPELDPSRLPDDVPSVEGKPVLVMRDTTERPEGVEAGTLRLVGNEEETIYSSFRMLLENEEEYSEMANAVNPYGDGYASKRIVDILEKIY